MEQVVITGLGALMPVGNTMEDCWRNLLAGESGITRVTRYDDPRIPCQVAGEVKGFKPRDHFASKDAGRLDPHVMYGIVTAREAIKDAGIDPAQLNPVRGGVFTAVALFGAETVAELVTSYQVYGPEAVKRHALGNSISSMLAGAICRETGFKGFCMNIQTACASSTTAVGLAFQLLQSGAYDCIIVTGSEAALVPEGMSAWCSLSTASTSYNDDPTRACRPFDDDRDGLVMSEGAATVVMETERHARARGARPYARVVSFAQSNDAYSPYAPHSEGQLIALRGALEQAGIQPSDIGYVNTHGTGTILGDLVEAETLVTIFGRGNEAARMGCTKSMTGHSMGSIGSFEAAVCALALRHKKLPPNLNIDNPIEKLGWIGRTAEDAPNLRYALTENFGFGGCNAALVLEALDG